MATALAAPLIFRPAREPAAPPATLTVVPTVYGDHVTFALAGTAAQLLTVCDVAHARDIAGAGRTYPDVEMKLVLTPAHMRAAVSAAMTAQPEQSHRSVYAMAALLHAAETSIDAGHILASWDAPGRRWVGTPALAPSVVDALTAAAATVADAIGAPGHPRWRTEAAAYDYAVGHAHECAQDAVAGWGLPTDPDAHQAITPMRTYLSWLCPGDTAVLTLTPPQDPQDDWTAALALNCVHVDGLTDGDAVLEPDSDHGWAHTHVMSVGAATVAAVHPVRGLAAGPVALRGKRLADFCDRIPDWRAHGIEVFTPAGLFQSTPATVTVQVTGATAGMVAAGLELNVTTTVDGRTLSPADIAALADSAAATLVHTTHGWMRTPENVADVLAAAALAGSGHASAADIINADLSHVTVDASEVTGWVGDVLRGVPPLAAIEPVPLPEQFEDVLRDYQKAGVAWLTWCEANNVGGILADHMGLGKTVQLLARITVDHPGPTLVVAPTTLIDNWIAEVHKFAPTVTVAVFHGPTRDLAAARDADIVLTTYTLLGSDARLSAVPWHRVILDEAQAIKNPNTKAARAARALQATHRFAVTGTPIENHVGDLWSLMSFAVPGLLGSFAAFRRRYLTDPTEESTARLAKLTSPFILRRLKTDTAIISDLPEKIVLTHHTGLTRAQVGAYEAVTRRLRHLSQDHTSALARRGAILVALTRLKQACVHHQLADSTYPGGLSQSSGKLDELAAIVTEAADNGEAVLVFTQFASFLPALSTWLRAATGLRVATLDGSMTRRARSAVVREFNAADGPDVLAVSLKAGGVGLNLVRANHVVHLDRWWNPAVEQQASDRAWRIGQTRNVIVHNLVCAGTVEDRIDELLSAKRASADALLNADTVIAAVTELSDDELHAFVSYARSEHGG